MSDREPDFDLRELERAEVALEVCDRLRRGHEVRPEDFPGQEEALRGLLPTLRLMSGLPAPESIPPAIGRLGDFRLVREVSRGGMGVVYEAIQESLGRRVALKVLPQAAALDDRQLRRFRVESQAAASLNHPNIVPVFATGSAEGSHYYAMRFIDGRDLARVIRSLRRDDPDETELLPATPRPEALPLSARGPGFVREAARLAKQAAEALDHAHAADILHRDIKPSNLIVDDGGTLWVADFGLARFRGGLDLTATGEAPGTPRYMSPEQALGRRAPLDGRADIYSLGVTFYELLTLRPAFPGTDRVELLRRIAHEQPVRPSRIDATIPADLETIILKAMEKAPEHRYATAAELADDLGRFLEGRPILARRPGLAERVSRWLWRHRAMTAAAAGGLALALAGVGLAGLRYTTVLRAEVERADRNAEAAERHRYLADRHYVAAQLRLAQQAVEARDFETAQDLLDEIGPGSGYGASAEFAFRLLDHLATRELLHLPDGDGENLLLSASLDGRTAASHHGPGSITVWDIPARRLRFRIEELGYRNRGPRISSDGRLLVATRWRDEVGARPEIAVWDASTGGPFATRHVPDAPPADRVRDWVRLLAGDRLIALEWVDDHDRVSVRIWKLEPGLAAAPPLVSMDGLAGFVGASDAACMATVEGGRLKIREAETGTMVREYADAVHGHEHVLSADGRILATSVDGTGILLRGALEAREPSRLAFAEPLHGLAFDPTCERLAAVTAGEVVHVWDLRDGRRRSLEPHAPGARRGPVQLTFSTGGGLLVTYPRGRNEARLPTRVWDVETGALKGELPCWGEDTPSRCVFLPGDRSMLAGVGMAPRIWNFEPEPESPQPAGHADEAWAAAYSPDGRLLATGSNDTDERRTIKLWEPETGREVLGWHGGEGTVSSIAFSPDGRQVATGHLASAGNLRIWDAATGRLVKAIDGHPDRLRSVAFSPDGRTVAAAGGLSAEKGRDWTIRLFDPGTGARVRELPGHSDTVRSVAFTPDGRRLISTGNDRLAHLWDIESGSVLATARGAFSFAGLAVSPDGRFVAIADEAGAVTVRDTETLAARVTFRPTRDLLLNLAYSHDGRSIASCGRSGVIRVWDAATGQEMLVLDGQKARVNAVAFAPDGSSLAACSHDGRVRLWRAGQGRLGAGSAE
ncbi:Serine/threonine-protein kinase PrkC [Aquisphaera giovannonii]|uniref:Serine/threonine-protein kinase PrkC n=1 Tax=Aquisphaera giovannonii TaxID=406548 RepID=A0A5B9WAL7_9BACT|nr:protein kinase [Aquisphaera giovannonii]QEH37071.1 Serine/threonine-protein kinase PrkC [Aquisphaera giovannonii]